MKDFNFVPMARKFHPYYPGSKCRVITPGAFADLLPAYLHTHASFRIGIIIRKSHTLPDHL